MILIALLVCLSIGSRIASVYVPGLTEYSGYTMAAASFLALAYTFHEGGHIRVEIIISRLAPKWRRFAELWCLGIATFISVFLAYYMARLAYFSWKFEERSEGADAVLLWKPQLAAVLGAMLLAIAIVHSLVRCFVAKNFEPPHLDHG